MRLAYYAGASAAAAAACLLKAFHQRPNFYSATVYLSQSNACLLILTNLCLVLACGSMYALQRLLYGPLRPIEIEQLSEKAWYAVLDTLLAMPSFREDVGAWLLTMFVLLLAGKVWGWIGEGRVDILEQQPPANPRLFHARLSTSLVLSVLFDIYMLDYCVESVLADPRPGMMVIFTFEFAILSIFSTFTLCRYGLTVTETLIVQKQTKLAIEARKGEIRAERAAARQNEAAEGEVAQGATTDDEPIEVDEQEVDVPGWEDKRRYLFVLEVFTDFIKLIIYIFFFAVSITFNGLPMHIIRDVYMTFASFSKRVTDYVAYRKATSDMNARYPDATTEEIRDDACIVCRENMVAWATTAGDAQAQEPAAPPPATRPRDEGLRAKKLPCGHILHLRCLKAWLERQQVCPTCRRPVVAVTTPDAATAGAQNQGAAQGQQGQQHQPQRQNRARIFNLGPIRVGLLNAPNGQLQNIVDQLRNPDAGNQNRPDAANQQGPNHLQLDVPYGPGQNGAQPGATQPTNAQQSQNRARRASVPTQIQLMQIEQRLMREAHNLGLEQQQLGTLRMMEAELARLRAHYAPERAPVGMQRQAGQLQMPLTATPLLQPNVFMPQLQAPPDILRGDAASQLSNGHDALPDGLVLPDGWSIMPLHRFGGNVNPLLSAAQDASTPMPPTEDASTAPYVQPGTADTLRTDSDAAVAQATNTAPVLEQLNGEQQTSTSQTGPTDDQGSPLFVPTAIHQSSADSSDAEDSSASEDSVPNVKHAWGDEWSFSNVHADSSPEEPDDSSGRDRNNRHTGVSSLEEPEGGAASEQSYSGKGKARAVEIEDAPDPDAGS